MGELADDQEVTAADEQEIFAADEEEMRKAEKIIENVSSLHAPSLLVCFKKKCKPTARRYRASAHASYCSYLSLLSVNKSLYSFPHLRGFFFAPLFW